MKPRSISIALLLTGGGLAFAGPKPAAHKDAPAAVKLDPEKNQSAINDITIKLGGVLSEMTALDESDKKIKQSDDAQVATSEMLKSQENKILQELMPAIQSRADQWDVKRQAHIDGGCPAEGGETDIGTANRCNAETDTLMAERKQIFDDAEFQKSQLATIAQTRQAVTDTTMANFTQRKANANRRDELLAQKKELEASLLKLKSGVDSCRKQLARRNAPCEKIKHDCGMIEFDGADPDLPPSIKDSPCPPVP